MKSWFIKGGAQRTDVELRDVPVPEPKAGEVLAKLHAAGLNRGEFIAGHGLSGVWGMRFFAASAADMRKFPGYERFYSGILPFSRQKTRMLS